jgi:hypothetical protein
MKIYSNQFTSETVIPLPESGVITSPNDWWFAFNYETKKVIGEPMQLYSLIHTPLSIFVSDSLEDCEQYILDNNLITKEPNPSDYS